MVAAARSEIPVSGIIPISRLRGEDEHETALLCEMAARAADYLKAFSWCGSITDSYFGGGVGKVFAIFFFRIQPASADVDEWLWVAVGEVPSAYIIVQECPTPLAAFDMYIWGMQRWVGLAREGRTSADVPEINVPPTPEWAAELDSRLEFLITMIRPVFVEQAQLGLRTA